jgi:hypothetical protein
MGTWRFVTLETASDMTYSPGSISSLGVAECDGPHAISKAAALDLISDA